MLTVILLMSGRDQPFQEAGYIYPKNLVEIDGAPLVQRVIEGVAPLDGPDTRLVCVIPKAENRRHHTGRVIQLIRPGAIITETNGATGGAACSALLAIAHIDRDAPLVIVNGDIVIDHPLDQALAEFTTRGLDGGVIAFHDVHPRWSFIKLGADDLAVEFAEKQPISDLATTGLSWFARGGDFLEAAVSMLNKDAHVDGQFFVSPVYNEMILSGRRVGCRVVPKSAYFSLKTPQDVRAYEEVLANRRRRCA